MTRTPLLRHGPFALFRTSDLTRCTAAAGGHGPGPARVDTSPVSWLDRIRAIRMDVTPLRTSRDFRLLFVAGTVFYLGGMISYVAIPYQLYTLTGSNAAVGLIGLVELRAAPRRRPVRRSARRPRRPSQAARRHGRGTGRDHRPARPQRAPGAAGGLAALRPGLLPRGVLQRPATLPRGACSRRTVRHDEIVAANALGSFGMQVGLLLGPTIGGLLLAHVGVAWCFAVDVVGLVVATVLYAAMRPYPHRDETTPPSMAAIVAGHPLRRVAQGPARHLPRRHRRDAARHPGRALPGLRAGHLRAAGAAGAASTPPRRSGRWSPRPPAAGRAGSTTTAGPSSSPLPSTGSSSASSAWPRRSGSRWRCWRAPARPT